MYDDHLREHWPETVASIQKDVRVCQWKLRRLKQSIDGLKEKERDQQAQIAALAGQNRELLERASLSDDMVDEEVRIQADSLGPKPPWDSAQGSEAPCVAGLR